GIGGAVGVGGGAGGDGGEQVERVEARLGAVNSPLRVVARRPGQLRQHHLVLLLPECYRDVVGEVALGAAVGGQEGDAVAVQPGTELAVGARRGRGDHLCGVGDGQAAPQKAVGGGVGVGRAGRHGDVGDQEEGGVPDRGAVDVVARVGAGAVGGKAG